MDKILSLQELPFFLSIDSNNESTDLLPVQNAHTFMSPIQEIANRLEILHLGKEKDQQQSS